MSIQRRSIEQSLADALECLSLFVANVSARDTLADLSQRLADTFSSGGKVLIAGNGGSMADATHFAEELTGRFRRDRKALPALSLNDPAHLSCVANDYGYAFVFSRMVEAFAKPGDVIILLTTSGNSENLVKAAEAAKSCDAYVFGFLGKSGGDLLARCDNHLIAPGESSDRIQEIHMMCLHILVETVEKLLELA